MGETGATPEQIEAAYERSLYPKGGIHRGPVLAIIRSNAAALVPPDHRIVSADRLARLVAAARIIKNQARSLGYGDLADALTDADLEGVD